MHRTLAPVLAATLAALTTAQNLVPNGEFHEGSTGWTLIAFNDPSGSTGFQRARTAGHGPSDAMFADFQTLTPVMSATYRSTPVGLPAVALPIGFRVMWEKQVTTPIPAPAVNRVELRIREAATNTIVYTGTQTTLSQPGLFERATFLDVVTVPATGVYEFELFLRHSNLANMPFTCWVDDVFCGGRNVDYFGQGCMGMGGLVPAMGTSGSPTAGSNNFRVELSEAMGPTAAVFMIDLSNTNWAGGSLPFALGNGCNLLVGGSVALFHVITTTGVGNGTASQLIPLQNPGLSGLRLFSQWAVFDPAAGNLYGVAMSTGLDISVQ